MSDGGSSNNKEHLETAKNHFESTLVYPSIEVDISVRRRRFKKRLSPFDTEDLVFSLVFRQQGTGKLPLIGQLLSVYQALKVLIDITATITEMFI